VINISKFANFMHLFDMKNAKLIERVVDKKGNLKPKDKQEEVYIPIRFPDLKSQCATCMFCSVCTTNGLVDEMGIGGKASNQNDVEILDCTTKIAEATGAKVRVGLKQVIKNDAQKIDLRNPTTIIIAEGQMWACYDRMRKGSFLLKEDEPGCENYKEKIKPRL